MNLEGRLSDPRVLPITFPHLCIASCDMGSDNEGNPVDRAPVDDTFSIVSATTVSSDLFESFKV